MKKNRIWIGSFVLVMCLGLLLACQKSSSDLEETRKDLSDKDKISVVCTIFPQYDWVKEMIGENIEQYDLTLLLDKGVDLHSYQPTAEDIAKISECDLFIYVGGESDKWVDDALKEAANKDMQVINLLDVLGGHVKEEEVVEGMEMEEGEEEEEEPEYDEHVWLSVKNAEIISENIEKALEVIDSGHASDYKENYDKYVAKLQNLDGQYQEMVDSAARKTVLFGDRFPFRYMVDDYGLDYYAAFVGCSAETEAGFDTIAFLAGKVDELELPCVLVIESSDQKIANTIIQNTKEKNQQILVMDSLQSITSDDAKNGKTYLSVMKSNLEILKQALNLGGAL